MAPRRLFTTAALTGVTKSIETGSSVCPSIELGYFVDNCFPE